MAAPVIEMFEVPDPKFDPLDESNKNQLSRYGIPPRPDDKNLEKFWKRLFGGTPTWIMPRFAPANRREPGFRGMLRTPAFTHIHDSRNWSGAFITPTRPNRFITVVGEWKIPEISLPTKLPSGADPQDQWYKSSTWIGTGGKRRYPNASLPQIGTSQELKVTGGAAGSPEIGAWWQWWVNHQPDTFHPQKIVGFPTHAGDVILAWLTVTSPDNVLFVLYNESENALNPPFIVNQPNSIMPLGSFAEWIHERPTKIEFPQEMYPLPKFDDFRFKSCMALSGGESGMHLQGLKNARRLRMYEMFDNPHRPAFVSLAEFANSQQEIRVFFRD